MEPRSIRVEGAHGIEHHLLEWSSEGVPLLMLHGFSNQAHIWDDLAPLIAPHYRVLAMSLAGHGDSDHDEKARYSYQDHADHLEKIALHFGFDRMILCGHSFGGRISMIYAGRRPEQVAGMILVDVAPELDPRGTTRIQMEVGQHRDPSFATRGEYEELLAHNYPAATPAAIRRMAENEIRQREDGRFVFKMDVAYRGARGPQLGDEERAKTEADDVEEMWRALEILDCPVLVVRGAASDIMSPEVADRMAEDVLKKGQLAVIPQCGHSVMTDNPEAFGKAVTDFVLG